jgi:hypothetical protein
MKWMWLMSQLLSTVKVASNIESQCGGQHPSLGLSSIFLSMNRATHSPLSVSSTQMREAHSSRLLRSKEKVFREKNTENWIL